MTIETIGNATLICGDVRDILPMLDAESIQTCVTSPPYWGLRDYGVDGQIGLEQTPAEYVTEMTGVFEGVWRVLRKDGTVWLNLGDSYAAQRGGTQMPAETLAGGYGGHGDEDSHRGRLANSKQHHRDAAGIGLKHKDLVGIPWRVAFALQSTGWYLRQDIIWAKPNPMPESVTDRCTKSHEYIFLMSKAAKYFYDAAAIAEPAAQPGRERLDRFGGNKYIEGVKHSDGSTFTGSETRNKRSVWTVPTQGFPGAHFATFPPKLIEPCILAGAPVGGVVLDPFMGSGTTGMVALKHGRRFVGIELNPEYFRMACDRIRAVADETALLEHTEIES